MIRTVVTPENQDINLHLPESYVGKKIEVIAFAIDEASQEPKKMKMSDFWGTISDETAAELHKEVAKSRDEWEDRLNKQF
jgi:hypothetical protein